MARKVKELSPLEVGRIGVSGPRKTPGLYAVGGVAGLYMQVAASGARSWILRIVVGGKRRDMGLGGFPDVPLAQAREKARDARAKVDGGADPILERQQAASRLKAMQASSKTFEWCARQYINDHGDAWRNPKHRQQWVNTLEAYAFPTIGQMLVSDVGQPQVLEILESIWKEKTETAVRLRGRIELVLDWAKTRGYRSGDNPAAWKGRLDKLLPKPSKIAKTEHHRALGIDEMGKFMACLRQREGMAAKALEFAILTAARSGEVRGAQWSEIDLKVRVWTVPAARMKAGREHRVPLSDAAVQLLQGLPRIEGTDVVFPGVKGQPLSDMSLTAVMRRMDVDAVPHGFRSTFRDWAGERTAYPRELAETALAHTLENKVEAAYRRGDALEKRRQMMQAWAEFCSMPATSGAVVPINRAA